MKDEPKSSYKLSAEDQALLSRVSTTYTPTEDRPIWHGQTGTTYGGARYSPLVRSIWFHDANARYKGAKKK